MAKRTIQGQRVTAVAVTRVETMMMAVTTSLTNASALPTTMMTMTKLCKFNQSLTRKDSPLLPTRREVANETFGLIYGCRRAGNLMFCNALGIDGRQIRLHKLKKRKLCRLDAALVHELRRHRRAKECLQIRCVRARARRE
jgi:hypothetical protein